MSESHKNVGNAESLQTLINRKIILPVILGSVGFAIAIFIHFLSTSTSIPTPKPRQLNNIPPSTSCKSYIQGMFEGFRGDRYGRGHLFYIVGTRITARDGGGYSSFTMKESYSTREGLLSTASSKKAVFTISLDSRGVDVIQGKFQDVFPGRGGGESDLTTLRVYRNGDVQIVLNDWQSRIKNLSNLACYPGHAGSTFVLTGQSRTSDEGFDFWTFSITPD